MPLVVPYQGCTNYSTGLPVAMPSSAYANRFCYRPGTINVLPNNPINPAMNIAADCANLDGSATAGPQPLDVALSELRASPCALSITLAPVLPVRRCARPQCVTT